MKTFALFLISMMYPFCAGAFEWPVKDGVLLSTFGSKSLEQISTGICIGMDEQPVQPILSGEVVYYFDEARTAFGVSSGLGSFVALQHEGGLRSIYAHLEPGTIPLDRLYYTREDSLGITGLSGTSVVENVCLIVVDMEYSQMVNPLLLLPHREDSQSPVIQTVFFRRDDTVLDISKGGVIQPGGAELIVQVFDPGENVTYLNPMTPFEIRVYVNGEEKSFLLFEGAKEEAGTIILVNSRSQSYNDIDRGENLYSLGMIDVNPGETRLEISVKDFIGNEASRIISLVASD